MEITIDLDAMTADELALLHAVLKRHAKTDKKFAIARALSALVGYPEILIYLENADNTLKQGIV